MIAGDGVLLVVRTKDACEAFTAKQLADTMFGRRPRRGWADWAPGAVTKMTSIGPDNKPLLNLVTCVHDGGEQPVIRIVTECDRAVTVAASCLVLTPEGHKRAYELTEQDLVTILPWPRKFNYLAPTVPRDTRWRKYSQPATDKIVAVIDTGFAVVHDFDLEYPFNNYSANEIVVSSG